MEKTDRQIIDSWLKRYVESSLRGGEGIGSTVKGCHLSHFHGIGMDGILEPYVGNLGAFLAFLTEEWKWLVAYDEENGIITADENKDGCVCPLYRESFVSSPRLCDCSEGFAESMFAAVLKRKVVAKVIRSHIRDGKSCAYEIRIGNEEKEPWRKP